MKSLQTQTLLAHANVDKSIVYNVLKGQASHYKALLPFYKTKKKL